MYTPLLGQPPCMAKVRRECHTLCYEDQAMYTSLLGPALLYTPLLGPALLLGKGQKGVSYTFYEDQAMYTLLLGPAHLHGQGLMGVSYTLL